MQSEGQKFEFDPSKCKATLDKLFTLKCLTQHYQTEDNA